MELTRHESSMLDLSAIKPLLGALGFFSLAAVYAAGFWQWLAENNKALAGAAAALNILFGLWRAGVWLRRSLHRRKAAQEYLSNKPRWWLK